MDYVSYLRQHGISPEKRFGQNFLISEKTLDDIISFSGVVEGDKVLEVGPGTGFLTEKLLQAGVELTAVEYSDEMCSFLKKRFDVKTFDLICDDVLKINIPQLFCGDLAERVVGDYVVVANIPYYITGKIIRLFLESQCAPKRMYLMVQKEVGLRLVSDKEKESVLSLTSQFYADVNYGFDVPKDLFYPAPKVDSCVVEFVMKDSMPDVDRSFFFRLVKGVFKNKRKKILNGLTGVVGGDKEKAKAVLIEAGVSSEIRPENLSFDSFVRLARALQSVEN